MVDHGGIRLPQGLAQSARDTKPCRPVAMKSPYAQRAFQLGVACGRGGRVRCEQINLVLKPGQRGAKCPYGLAGAAMFLGEAGDDVDEFQKAL